MRESNLLSNVYTFKGFIRFNLIFEIKYRTPRKNRISSNHEVDINNLNINFYLLPTNNRIAIFMSKIITWICSVLNANTTQTDVHH